MPPSDTTLRVAVLLHCSAINITAEPKSPGLSDNRSIEISICQDDFDDNGAEPKGRYYDLPTVQVCACISYTKVCFARGRAARASINKRIYQVSLHALVLLQR